MANKKELLKTKINNHIADLYVYWILEKKKEKRPYLQMM